MPTPKQIADKLAKRGPVAAGNQFAKKKAKTKAGGPKELTNKGLGASAYDRARAKAKAKLAKKPMKKMKRRVKASGLKAKRELSSKPGQKYKYPGGRVPQQHKAGKKGFVDMLFNQK